MVNKLGNRRDLLGRLAAELAVIVLGVTIALWADGWVAERRDRAVEFARLAALQDNIQDTLQELHTARDIAADAAATLRDLVSLQQRERPYDEVQKLLRFGFLYGSTFYPVLNVYDDLKNSGELALLTNAEVRQSLATMDTRLELVQFAQADLTTVQQLNIDPYMIDHFNLLSFYGSLTGLEDPADNSPPDLQFTSDVTFRNLVLFKLDLVTQLEESFENAETALVAVEQSIGSQLTKQTR
jgi:hypothetical protein